MTKQNDNTSKIKKALFAFEYLSEGNLMIGKDYLGKYLSGIFNNSDNLKTKRGKLKSVQHIKDIGSDYYEKSIEKYNILIGEKNNLYFIVYNSNEKTKIIDSRSFNTKGDINLDKRIFKIFEKGGCGTKVLG